VVGLRLCLAEHCPGEAYICDSLRAAWKSQFGPDCVHMPFLSCGACMRPYIASVVRRGGQAEGARRSIAVLSFVQVSILRLCCVRLNEAKVDRRTENGSLRRVLHTCNPLPSTGRGISLVVPQDSSAASSSLLLFRRLSRSSESDQCLTVALGTR
jgi:hypothetical protein